MKEATILILISAVLLGVVGCAQPVAGEVIQSAEQRITASEAGETDITALVEGNSVFAFDLYQSLKEGNDNLFYSPYSISLALAMTYGGARSETAQQMADALHFTLSQDSLHPAFNSLDTELGERGEGARGKDEEGFRLNIVNAIWGQKDYQFLSEYLDLLAQNYGAGLRVLDFISTPEESRVTINDWVSDQTEGRIEDLIPQGVINALTRLVLTNAIYFNAAWQYPFDENATTDNPFYLLDGSEGTVPMMRQTESFGYTAGDGYQAIELPYDGNELSMVILLPEQGRFETLQNSLSVQQVDAVVDDLERVRVTLTMPKFEFTSSFSLKKALAEMGMPLAFSSDADLSGMTGSKELFITEVVHKAFVAVDEKGTEAAAATAVVVGLTSMPAEPIEVSVDRPFIFLIRDIETSALLFVGRVMDPSA